jgi:hypothetical protein
LVYPEEERQHFIKTFAGVEDRKQLHWALICLINLLYGQQPDRLVKLRLDQVRETDAGYEVLFAKIWLPLDPVAQPLMRRWMSSRREFGAFDETNSSPYLFPGMRSGTHLTATASGDFRRKHDYNARAGRVTAIAKLIQNGLTQIKVLTDCFGISAIRAQLYLEHFGARQHHPAQHVYRHHAKP